MNIIHPYKRCNKFLLNRNTYLSQQRRAKKKFDQKKKKKKKSKESKLLGDQKNLLKCYYISTTKMKQAEIKPNKYIELFRL